MQLHVGMTTRRDGSRNQARWSLAYSALASFRMGMSGSASFQAPCRQDAGHFCEAIAASGGAATQSATVRHVTEGGAGLIFPVTRRRPLLSRWLARELI